MLIVHIKLLREKEQGLLQSHPFSVFNLLEENLFCCHLCCLVTFSAFYLVYLYYIAFLPVFKGCLGTSAKKHSY